MWLRDATAPTHERVEKLWPLSLLMGDYCHYERWLLAQQRWLEECIAALGGVIVLPEVVQSGLRVTHDCLSGLTADLAGQHCDLPTHTATDIPAPDIGDRTGDWAAGVMYVVLGSSRGASIIHAALQKRSFQDETRWQDQFLHALTSPETSRIWSALVEWLDASDGPADREAVLSGALWSFSVFAAQAWRIPAPPSRVGAGNA